jgi:hypothetical protein
MAPRSLARDAHPDPEESRDLEHIAKTVARMLMGSCIDCGVSGRDAILYPVGDDHLTFFSGDELCRECAIEHGAL